MGMAYLPIIYHKKSTIHAGRYTTQPWIHYWGVHFAGRRVSPGDGGQEANAASTASTGKPTTRTQPPKTWSRRQSHEVIVETKDLGPLVWVPGIKKVPGVHKRHMCLTCLTLIRWIMVDLP